MPSWPGYLPRTAKLATVRPTGGPTSRRCWYDFFDDDGSLVFTTGEKTVKGRNMLRDPRASVCVDDDRPPFSFVVVEGVAEIDDDPGEVRRWATRIGGRYMGAERAEDTGRERRPRRARRASAPQPGHLGSRRRRLKDSGRRRAGSAHRFAHRIRWRPCRHRRRPARPPDLGAAWCRPRPPSPSKAGRRDRPGPPP